MGECTFSEIPLRILPLSIEESGVMQFFCGDPAAPVAAEDVGDDADAATIFTAVWSCKILFCAPPGMAAAITVCS